MERRSFLLGCTIGIVGTTGCLGDESDESEEGPSEVESREDQQEFVDKYGSYERRISNGIEDYERGQELVDSENYLEAEKRFRDAERELAAVSEDLFDLRVDARMEFGEDSEVVKVLDSISGMVTSYESAAEMGKEGSQSLADGKTSGVILTSGAKDLIEETEEVEMPSETEFSTMILSE